MKWNVSDIPNLNGKIAIVTGSNTGLGLQTAKALASRGCHVILACRSKAKGLKAKDEILKLSPHAEVEVEELDLASFISIKHFCNRIKENHSHLSLLINNAGVINITSGSKSKDGFELIFATNYLGPFALTAQLLPLLEADGKARIVTVGSNLHKNVHLNFKNLSGYPYNRLKAYANSKLADLVFAFELDRRLKAHNYSSISLAAHPGYAATSISDSRGDKLNNVFFNRLMTFCNRMFAQSPEKSALPILYAATAADVKGSEYYGPDGICELRGNPKLTYCASHVYNKEVAKKLWQISEKLTDVKFDIVYNALSHTQVCDDVISSSASVISALRPYKNEGSHLTSIKYGNVYKGKGYIFQAEPLVINANAATVWKIAKSIEQYPMLSNGAMIAFMNGKLQPHKEIFLKVKSLPLVKEKINIVNDELKLLCWGIKLPLGMGNTERYHYIEPISSTQCKSYIFDKIPSLVGFFSNLMLKNKIIYGFDQLNEGFKEEAELITAKRLS